MDTITRAPTKTVPEVLTEARALLLQDGWYNGGSMYPGSRDYPEPAEYRPGTPLCLIAACRVVDTGSPWSGDAREAIDALHATLERRFGQPYGVGSWQCSGGRTLNDVLQLIDDTIDYWRLQQGESLRRTRKRRT